MSETTSPPDNSQIDVILPSVDLLYEKETLDYILCKPKLLPLKSVGLEKLEKMQKDADAKMKAAREDSLEEQVKDK